MNALVEIPITEEIMRYVRAHLATVRIWIHGKPVKAYQEKDGRVSITYEDHCWWFYRKTADDEVVWE